MTIQVGDKIPQATMKVMGEKGPQDMTTDDLFAGKKVVLFALPGALRQPVAQRICPVMSPMQIRLKRKASILLCVCLLTTHL